jgi:hypothetical protein
MDRLLAKLLGQAMAGRLVVISILLRIGLQSWPWLRHAH